MKQRPLIAVTGDYDTESGRYFLKREYMEALWTAGCAPVILEPKIEVPMNWSGDREEYIERIEIEEEILDAVDGILFTGGNDVDPNFYGETIEQGCGTLIPYRDVWEMKLVRIAYERNIPSLGLCRGIQSMAAALGVKLTQDLSSGKDQSEIRHGQKAPTWYPTHQVVTKEGSLMREMVGEKCWVNSFHHQAIAPDQDYPFEITAWSEDGIIEGFEAPDKAFFAGVQWHPERMMHDEVQRHLFRTFALAALKASGE